MSNTTDLPMKTTWVSISVIVLVALIHLIEAPEYLEEAPYLGLLFLVNFAGAIVAAIGIYRGSWSWGWGLGTLVAASAFLGYILSRTVGLPGFYEDEFFESMGVLWLIVEALFVLLYVNGHEARCRVNHQGTQRP